jgi:hypothetical protein
MLVAVSSVVFGTVSFALFLIERGKNNISCKIISKMDDIIMHSCYANEVGDADKGSLIRTSIVITRLIKNLRENKNIGIEELRKCYRNICEIRAGGDIPGKKNK